MLLLPSVLRFALLSAPASLLRPMRPSPRLAAARRGGRIMVAVLAAALLGAGCSTLRLGYSQAPTAAYWWLDRYADFDDEQSPRVQARIDDWLRWHRATQLPDYAALLARAGREIVADASPAQVCGWIDTLAPRIDAGVQQALPSFAATAVTLKPAQIERIERRLAKNDETFRKEQVEAPAAQVAERRLDKAVDRAEMLYGRLGAALREQLARNVAETPYDAAAALAERQRRQREFVGLLRRVRAERLDAAQAQLHFAAYAERLRRPPDGPWQAHQQRLQAFNCDAAARLHNLTTPAQRQAAARRLAGWERDLRALAADAEP